MNSIQVLVETAKLIGRQLQAMFMPQREPNSQPSFMMLLRRID